MKMTNKELEKANIKLEYEIKALARRIVMNEIIKQGHNVSSFKPKEITRVSKQLLRYIASKW